MATIGKSYGVINEEDVLYYPECPYAGIVVCKGLKCDNKSIQSVKCEHPAPNAWHWFTDCASLHLTEDGHGNPIPIGCPFNLHEELYGNIELYGDDKMTQINNIIVSMDIPKSIADGKDCYYIAKKNSYASRTEFTEEELDDLHDALNKFLEKTGD